MVDLFLFSDHGRKTQKWCLFSETNSAEEHFQGFAARDTRRYVEVAATKAALFHCLTPIKFVQHDSSSWLSDYLSLSREEDVSQSPNISNVRRGPPVILFAGEELTSSSLEGEIATETFKCSGVICFASAVCSWCRCKLKQPERWNLLLQFSAQP